MSKLFIKIILTLFCLLSFVRAETLQKFENSGNQRISDQTIIIFSEIEINEEITKSKLDKVIKKLYKTNFFKNIKSSPLNFETLNNLNLHKVKKEKFPLVGLLNKLPKYPSLFETVLITVNDYLVYKFLNRKISFQELNKLIKKISNYKEFQKFKKIKPRNIKQIYNLRDYVHLKLNTLGI